MKMNFRGLVNMHSLPKSEALLPLYEAVINSIQSIEEAQIEDGKIVITIERENQLTLFDQWETDVQSIEILDNGVGFHDKNFNSFNTYASDYKLKKGCKGVGRMLWLKAFADAEIESVYIEGDRKKCRKFMFDADHAVHGVSVEDKDVQTPRTTRIRLNGLRVQYKKYCPKKLDTIARNILNHCFIYFVMGKAPQIIVRDEMHAIEVNRLYREQIGDHTAVIRTKINGISFTVIHSRNYACIKEKHAMYFCADQWVVQPMVLPKVLGNAKLEDENGPFVYNGYVMSQVLDSHVNRERTRIELPDTSDFVEPVGMHDITECMEKLIREYLSVELEKSNEKKEEMIRDYVNKKNPRYQMLLKNRPASLEEIPWVTDEEKLELELFRQEQKYKLELKQEWEALAEELRLDSADYDIYLKKREEYAKKISDMGKSSLSEYVMHRKAVLDLLARSTGYRDPKKQHFLERMVHQLIFPMKCISDDIDYLQHNLWIIDEKLAYHHYLASDRKLNQMPGMETSSGKEPDLLIFDSPFAFTDEEQQPYRNITIMEFKRPGRENYTEMENPIRQVKEYMDAIVEGKVRARDGRFFAGTENIRFYCYILCDIDDSMRKLSRLEDMKLTADGMGYYKYMESCKAYLEVIPYDKLIQDAEKRNKVLFDKLFNQI